MTFTFSRDDTRQCFDVSIFDDDINEPENKFLVMLSTGDPRITLSPDMATITILDNDGKYQFQKQNPLDPKTCNIILIDCLNL